MKSLIFISIFLASIYFVKGQQEAPPSCDSSAAKCNQNLKNTIFGPIDKQTNSYAKDPFPSDFKDVDCAGDSESECTTEDKCRNSDNSLVYKVYYPREHLYDPNNNGCPLPAIILFHAGGFSDCSSYDDGFIKDIAEQFAKRGFVVFVVEYRRGKIKGGGNFTSVQQQLAAWRACQDGRGAIRSIIKRQLNHYTSAFINDPYQIDLNRIFIGGASAGGVIAMLSAWYTPQMAVDAFPTPAGYTNIQTALGSIDADYYYGDVSIDYRSYIKGVLSMWGAIPIPYAQNQISFFSQTTLVPVIAFHGKKDKVFNYPYNKQDVFFYGSDSINYNKESRCLIQAHIN